MGISYSHVLELKKRKVERERKEQGKTWEFLIHVYMGSKKEKGGNRKEGIGKDMGIFDSRVYRT
jgi:hypothetical protein